MKPTFQALLMVRLKGIYFLLFLLMLACGGGGGGNQGISVSISGVNPYISIDENPVFTASVTGATDNSVTWSLQEGSIAGSISASGKYSPGMALGIFHVTAASKVDPSRSAVAAFQLVNPPFIRSFTANKGVVKSGEGVQLMPEYLYGTGSISTIGQVASGVPVTVTPTATTTYTLTVQNLAGRVDTSSVTVQFAALGGSFSLVTNSFPEDAHSQAATLLPSGQVLVTGGVSNVGSQQILTSVLLLDPSSGATRSLGIIPNGRNGHQQLPLGDSKVLIIGGGDLHGPSTFPIVYDTALNTGQGGIASTLPIYNFSWNALGTLLHNGKIFIYGGLNTIVYTPFDDSHTEATQFPEGRVFETLTTLNNGKVLIVGGQAWGASELTLDTASLYDPSTNTMEMLTSRMNIPRYGHTATLLNDGTVLVTGGFDLSGTAWAVQTAEIFDPATNQFSAPIPMNFTRVEGFTATLLMDGNVLVAGQNMTVNPNQAGICEIYSTSQKKFYATSAMIRLRQHSTATLLPNGKVLFVGGGGAGTPGGNSTVEVFNPFD